MSERYALLVSVEKYQDSKYGKVAFARADAEAMSDVLAANGFSKGNQYLLLDADATKARIDSHLRRALERLQEDDELYIYFVGHGFSDGLRNFIACYDTVFHDAARTSLLLQDIFEFVRGSRSHKVVLFLDTCHSGIEIDDTARAVSHGLTEPELRHFFDDAQYYVCFASCKSSEKSYPSVPLQHGIWTYHLVEALSGRAKEATQDGRLVTSTSLQRYLSKAVPLTLRSTRPELTTQTPVVFGNMTKEFLVADVDALIRAREAAAQAPEAQQLKRIALSTDRTARVTSLSGFRSHYYIPEKADERTNNWVASLATKEMTEALDSAYQDIKSHLRYRRKEMVIRQDSGWSEILTPDFTFRISVRLNERDTSQVIWKREIVNLANTAAANSPEFDQAFGDSFNRIEFDFSQAIDIAALIDGIEESHELEVEYPQDCSRCIVSADDFEFKLVVSPRSFSLEFQTRRTPRQLIDSFFRAQSRLLAEPEVRSLLSFA